MVRNKPTISDWIVFLISIKNRHLMVLAGFFSVLIGLFSIMVAFFSLFYPLNLFEWLMILITVVGFYIIIYLGIKTVKKYNKIKELLENIMDEKITSRKEIREIWFNKIKEEKL